MLEFVKKCPEELIKCTIWGSDFFTRNGSITHKKNYRHIPSGILRPIDIIKQSNFISIEEIRAKYGTCDEEQYISLETPSQDII